MLYTVCYTMYNQTMFCFRCCVFGRRLGGVPAALWKTAFQHTGNSSGFLFISVVVCTGCLFSFVYSRGFTSFKETSCGHIAQHFIVFDLWKTELLCIHRNSLFCLFLTHTMRVLASTTYGTVQSRCQPQNLRSQIILLYPAILLTSCALCALY